jgi:hypothetical protein
MGDHDRDAPVPSLVFLEKIPPRKGLKNTMQTGEPFHPQKTSTALHIISILASIMSLKEAPQFQSKKTKQLQRQQSRKTPQNRPKTAEIKGKCCGRDSFGCQAAIHPPRPILPKATPIGENRNRC